MHFASVLLYSAACLGHSAAVRALLAVAPKAATITSSSGATLLHAAAKHGREAATRVLLAAAPTLGYALNGKGQTPLHIAVDAGGLSLLHPPVETTQPECPEMGWLASLTEVPALPPNGNMAVVRLLVESAPGAAAMQDELGWSPLHDAAYYNHHEAAAALLPAAPAMTAAGNSQQQTPLHLAAQCGDADMVAMLLAALPAAAAQGVLTAAVEGDETPSHDCYFMPLHLAASRKCSHEVAACIVRVLVEAAPEVAVMTAAAAPAAGGGGAGVGEDAGERRLLTPLLLATRRNNLAAIKVLLQAAPAAAALPATGWTRDTPLHVAASWGNEAAVKLLLEAAPQAAAAVNFWGRTPLRMAIHRGQLPAARLLVAASPPSLALQALADAARSQPGALALFAVAVAAHLPLTEQQWQLVPAACPGLGRALPAALAHSEQQARQLVRHLTRGDGQRLRAFALALWRMQKYRQLPLPGPIVRILLASFDA